MKKDTLFLLIFFLNAKNSYGQVKLHSNGYQKSDTGFIYYTNPEDPSFVSVKEKAGSLGFNQFVSTNLNIAYQLNWQELALDTLGKYESRYKVYNYFNDTNIYLRIIPVEMKYTVLSYSKSEKQMKEGTTIEKFKLKNKLVVIKSIGGISIRVDDLKIFHPVLVFE